MRFTVEQRFSALEKLVVAASTKGLEEQFASYLCKLGCIQLCGNLERCVEILVTERIGTAAPPQVGSFLKSFFKRGTNYDCDEILQLLFKFDAGWGREFEAYITNNSSIKDSISSAYAVRNSIAHGGGASLGPHLLRQYFDASFDLIVDLEKMLRK